MICFILVECLHVYLRSVNGFSLQQPLLAPQPFGGASLLTPNPSSAPGQEPLLLDMSQPSDKVL